MQLFSEIVAVLLVLSTIAQCLVWWLGFGIFNRKTKNIEHKEGVPSNHITTQEAVTVIICARNEADNLQANLPSIFSQKYNAPYEVLVVNDASEDGTAQILEKFSKQYSNLKVLTLVNKELAGKKGALAAGVKAAKTEWIVVTDADCEPISDTWLRDICSQLTQADMILGYGPLREQEGMLNAWARYEVFITALQYYSFLFWKNPYMGVGRNMAWRKSLYVKTGGFEKHAHIMSGDDDLFVNEAAPKARIRACLIPDTFVYSDAKTTLKDYFTQKSRHLSTGKFYHWTHRFWLGFAALSHSCHYLFVATLILARFSMVFVLSIYVIRLVSVILVCLPALRKLKEEKLIPFLPLFDLLLPVFYLVFTPTIFLHKNNKPRSWT